MAGTTEALGVDVAAKTACAVAASGYRPDIDGLRAVSVLAVVAYHLYPQALHGGFVGVDVFFVISGFLIGQILIEEIDQRRFSFLGFGERRIRRIFPALLAMLLISGIAAFLLLAPEPYLSFVNSAAAAALAVSNVFFAQHAGYFDLGADSLPLLHTWSLAVEEQFYAAFPAIFLLGRRALKLPWWAILWPLAIASFCLCVAQTGQSPAGAFYATPARAWEFLVGALLAARAVATLRPVLAEIAALAGLSLIAASCILLEQQSGFPGWRALLPCAGAALVIVGPRSFVARGLSAWPMVALGRISYSLYLWHWPVFVFGRLLWGAPTPIMAAALVAVSLALATLSWWLVEEPPRRRRALFTRGRLFAGAALIAVVLLGQRYVANAAHGLPDRFGANALSFLKDDPWTPPPGCEDPMHARCVVGARGVAPTFAVVGDSIAESALPGLAQAAERQGRSGLFLARAGCYPLPDVQLGDAGCTAFERAAFASIRSDPDIGAVTLIARWPAAVEGRQFRHPAIATAQLSDRLASGTDPVANRAILAGGFSRAAGDVGARSLYVVAGIPEQGEPVAERAALRARFGFAPIPGLPRADYERRAGGAASMLAAAASASQATVLDATGFFCDREWCKATLGDRALYWDDTHLSVFGARQLAASGLYTPILVPQARR